MSRPALELAAAGPAALGRVEAEWPAALARLQGLGLYAGATSADSAGARQGCRAAAL